jgi:hypothetical protein
MVAARHWREDMVLAISSAIEASVAPPKLAAVGRSKPERVARLLGLGEDGPAGRSFWIGAELPLFPT